MTMHWKKTFTFFAVYIQHVGSFWNFEPDIIFHTWEYPRSRRKIIEFFLKASVDRKKNQKVLICSYIFLTSFMYKIISLLKHCIVGFCVGVCRIVYVSCSNRSIRSWFLWFLFLFEPCTILLCFVVKLKWLTTPWKISHTSCKLLDYI